MCGIFGYSELNDESRALMPYLACAMQGRGKDSWGGTDGQDVFKMLKPISEGYCVKDFDDYQQGVFHTRAASQGAVSLDNQHPFTFYREDGSPVVGVHNGCIGNHDELNKKFDRKFEVDSMHVYAHIAEKKALNDIHGWGALAYFDNGQMSFCRFNMEDFHLFKLKSGPIVFCSTKTPVLEFTRILGIEVEKEYTTRPETRYFIDDGDLKEGERMVFGYRGGRGTFVDYSVASSCNGTTWRGQQRQNNISNIHDIGRYSRQEGLCLRCSVAKIDRTKKAVCDGCYTDLLLEVAAPTCEVEYYG